ncbi:tripartite tricarboxylate transporter substrate binding protein (plasmid) [Diaphorobacter sp. HDW4B]|uniref:Bug family tripartite tricarboxylate transporter substrate binding protein n=1 Tax=Diaphorobacter sp. HDW4B TaxID=2714925 RepID=UPI00140E3016|nr:tripartite tricarboxylate transporter substrate binding protein [Diaphorobacter sp. HDW4B]QIL74271.1 tripartite tricarboxylate transporter substrate binding protein [Diaphorobacter sp. HDW4B]
MKFLAQHLCHKLARVASVTLFCVASGSLSVAHAATSDWPTKPITVVVPFPAGGGTDLIIRVLQPSLSRHLGQPIVIDNRGGAGGTIGSTQLARSRADGYTVGLVTTSTHAVAPAIYPKLGYNVQKDFSYAGLIGTTPYLLVATPAMGVDSMVGLQDKLKASSQSVSYGSVGKGTVSHLMGEQFQRQFGTAMIHVPYRGAAPAYTDLLGGQIQLMFDNPVGLVPYVRSGKIKALATTAATPLLPELKTFEQQGISGFKQQLWYGVAFPAQTPPAIVKRFSGALQQTLQEPEVAKALADYGVTVVAEESQAMAARVARDAKYWADVSAAAGVSMD